MAELGNPQTEAEDPLSNFSSTLSGTYVVPFTGLGRKNNMSELQASRDPRPPGQEDCLQPTEKLRGQEKGRRSATGILVGEAMDSAGPHGRPHGGSDSEKGLRGWREGKR